MSAAFFTAAVPEPFRILGLELKPLSLTRYYLLKRFDCAFVADNEVAARVSDLLLGLVICSMRVDEFLALASSPKQLAREIRRWGRKVCPCPWLGMIPRLGRWYRKRHHFDVVEKIALFKRYVELGSAVPNYWKEETRHEASAAHWTQSLDVVLRSQLGWTMEDINEEPLRKALALYFKVAENKGLIRLMSEAESAMVAEAEGKAGSHGA